MRLFIAINFDDKIKDELCLLTDQLKNYSVSGNFTRRENLHLTLVFIGETPSNKITSIKSAIDNIQQQPFDIKFTHIGKFKRTGGDIFWVGIDKMPALSSVYTQLYNNLTACGFNIESREYKPHLTLSRQMVLNLPLDYDNLNDYIPKQNITINKISLMKSERINGKLIYTEIYSKKL